MHEKIFLEKRAQKLSTINTKTKGSVQFECGNAFHSFLATDLGGGRYYLKNDGRALIIDSSCQTWFVANFSDEMKEKFKSWNWRRFEDTTP